MDIRCRPVSPVWAFVRAALTLRDDDDDDQVRRLWQAFTSAPTFVSHQRQCDTGRARTFARMVKAITGKDVTYCEDCTLPTLRPVHGDVCDACVTEYYRLCHHCDGWVADDEAHSIDDESYCRSCLERYYVTCWRCNEYAYHSDAFTVDGFRFCANCHDNLEYCERCEETYYQPHTCSTCECVPERRRFRFPIENGARSVASERRVTVTLPAGTVSREGMQQISWVVFDEVAASSDPNINTKCYIARSAVMQLECDWQTRTGNFPKRLQKAILQATGFKASAELISRIGNLARQHSGSQAKWHVEMSRNLNASAQHWYHGESCWWGSYSHSRCRLKGCGGLGMRTFDTAGDLADVTGRMWVIPLDAQLKPTHDTILAFAYLAFNAYGFEGYDGARVLAQMTGLSYRKIYLHADDDRHMYVNGQTGFLIANQTTCNANTQWTMFDVDCAAHGAGSTRGAAA